ncbi:MAG: TetR/AcrR family transcriptional regulator [Myxococcales bacterium]|nr:TetR/AcrR family transcriptional regulator [Myxococcales bacterium]
MSEEDEKAPRTRSKRAASDKRERILRAAIEVFAKNGFYATRVSEIAKAAGVADGTIYLYFENKDDVLVSIFEDRISKLLVVLRRALDDEDTIDGKVRRIIELQLGLLEGERDLAEVITVNLRQSSRLLKQYAAPLFRQYLELVAGVIAEGQKEGILRADVSPRVMARALWGALDGVALTWALGTPDRAPDPASLRRAATQLAHVFLDGLRA